MSRAAAVLLPRHERHERHERHARHARHARHEQAAHPVGHCPDERHDWRPGAGFGWYECVTCGQVGACVACHDPAIVADWPASWGARMRCPEHRIT